jgi:periplasmic divalent cation tolerance protein
MQYEPILVQFSSPDESMAKSIATELLNQKLVACVQVSQPVKSIYYWEGKVEEATEIIVQLKTFSIYWQAIESKILELHPYSVPEIIATPVREISHYSMYG